MEQTKVYRNLNTADKFLGLELGDGAALLLIFFLAFLFNRKGLFVNFAVLFAAYWALRAVKRGRPEGYLLVALRHVLTSRFKRLPDFDEIEESGGTPFRPRRGNTRP